MKATCDRPGLKLRQKNSHPHLGLVCITSSDEVRFRTLTRTRYLKLSVLARHRVLQELYGDNLCRLHKALSFCEHHQIRLYRLSSGLFPLSDDEIGTQTLEALSAELSCIGRRAARLGVRLVLHPDQDVVLNSESPHVVQTSRDILGRHARMLDFLELPRSTWAAMTIHGGKAGRAESLVHVIEELPEAVRSRLTLENDERAYSARETLAVCQRTGIPMVFDAHHHVCHDGLTSYEHSTVGELLYAARETWLDPRWQLVHLSNGRESFTDSRHSDFIHTVPSVYQKAPWIEVEAKAKEQAIARLRREWPAAA